MSVPNLSKAAAPAQPALLVISCGASLIVGILLTLFLMPAESEPAAETPAEPVPALAAVPELRVRPGEQVEFRVQNTNQDFSEELHYELDASTATGATIDAKSGWVRWTPDEKQAGKEHQLVLKAVPSNGGEPATVTTLVHVSAAEKSETQPSKPSLPARLALAPELKPLSDQTVEMGSELELQVAARDPNTPKAELHFELGADAPPGAEIQSPTGVLTWTPRLPGTYKFTVKVQRPDHQLVTEEKLTVLVRRPPAEFKLVGIADQTIQQGEQLSLVVGTEPKTEVQYKLKSPPVEGASLDPETGKFTWTPLATQQPGEYRFTVQASADENKRPAEATFSVHLNEKQVVLQGGKEAIRKALSEKSPGKFVETPLPKVLGHFSRQHAVPIVLDKRQLYAEGIDFESAVTRDCTGFTFDRSLTEVLNPLGLTWLIRDEVVFVTTKEKEAHILFPKVYRIKKPIAPQTLINNIERTTAQRSWSTTGGPGNMRWYYGTLIVLQTYHIHQEIQQQYPDTLQLVEAPDVTLAGKVGKALTEPTAFDFEATTLKTALEELGREHGIRITIDEQALKEEGVSLDSPLTLKLSGVSLGSALHLLVRPLGLAYSVREPELVITHKAQLQQRLYTLDYDVRKLLPRGRADALINAITNCVAPSAWNSVGGPGTIAIAGGALKIRTSEEVHHSLKQLMADLHKAID